MTNERRCGTCVLWEPALITAGIGFGHCEWPTLNQPASIATRPVMHEDDGKTCSQWAGGDVDEGDGA